MGIKRLLGLLFFIMITGNLNAQKCDSIIGEWSVVERYDFTKDQYFTNDLDETLLVDKNFDFVLINNNGRKVGQCRCSDLTGEARFSFYFKKEEDPICGTDSPFGESSEINQKGLLIIKTTISTRNGVGYDFKVFEKM